MEKLFRICNHDISITAPHFVSGNADWEAFEAREFNGGVNIRCIVNDRLPEVTAEECGKNADVTVYSCKERVYRKIAMGSAQGVLSVYSPLNPDESTAYFTRESFSTMTDSRYMWNSLALPQLFLLRKTLFLHSSYVDIGGKALLFAAPCGTGKSTQAELWRTFRQAEIINGDKSGISVCDGIYAHGVPFCGTSGICKNRTLPLGAVVFLSQSPENHIRRCSGIEAVQLFMSNTYLDFLAPQEQRMFVDTAIEIINKTPVYFYGCTPDEKAVTALEKVLKSEGVV